MASLSGTTTITFQSQGALQSALSPHSFEEVRERLDAKLSLSFQYDPTLKTNPITTLRNRGTDDLLNIQVFSTKTLSVFYPKTPRVPDHLAIVLNRKDVKGLADISDEENRELFATIRKIAEIYKTRSIDGFVIAQYDTPQQGHQSRFVVEIIPHLPGFNRIRNMVDKMDCNRYVLFRSANLSPVRYEMDPNACKADAEFWKMAFQRPQAPLSEKDLKITFPNQKISSHLVEADQILQKQLSELWEDMGGSISPNVDADFTMPTKIPSDVKIETTSKCYFCESGVINRQLVYEGGDAIVLYNIRKAPYPGMCFLILPKRHVEKVYGLTEKEISEIAMLRRALSNVLKEAHPSCQVVDYTQNDPSVGQTVFHSHEQVVAIHPQTGAFAWTFMSLCPIKNVDDEEMARVCKEFKPKLEQKIKEAAAMEKIA